MTNPDPSIIGLIHSGWSQIVAIVGIIWWSRKIDLRTQDHRERLDRHDLRITAQDQTQQLQAVQNARIEETLAGIKLTLDRLYAEVREMR